MTGDGRKKEREDRERSETKMMITAMTVSGILYHVLQESQRRSRNDKSEVRTGFLCVDVCVHVFTLTP